MKRIRIGTITGAHGIKGLVKIQSFAEDTSLLGGELHTAETGGGTLKVALKNPAGKCWLASVVGVTDRDEAERLAGTALYIDKSRLPALEHEDEFYHADLAGLTVTGPDGKPAGTVIGVHNYGAGDLLEIKPPTGEPYLVPFTKACVPAVDIGAGMLTLADYGDL